MVDQQTIYFCVNGIQNWPGNPKNWNKRGCTWLHLNTPFKAQCDEYFTTALTVWIKRQERAKTLAALIRQFAGWRIIIVAHSNGGWVAVNALNLLKWQIPIAALHLVSGACDGNFTRNGLNDGLKTGVLSFCGVYIAGKDKAMRVEETLAGRCLFGIYPGDKPLGLGGATQVWSGVANNPSRFKTVTQDDYGHSDWWLPANFDGTMKYFLTP